MRALTRRGLVAGALLAPAVARGQEAFPRGPLKLVVGFPPGTAADIVARLVAPGLGAALGQPVVVENRPGAGSSIAAEAVARAAPDGHTLFLVTNANAIAQATQPALGFDLRRGFAPVGLLADVPNLLVVHPSLGVRSVAEFIAYAKARPEQVFYGSSGIATVPHLSGELFNQQAGVKLVHVPYAGSGQAMTDLIAGRVQVVFAPVSTALPQVEAGKVVALAATSARRSALVPSLPTVAEAGLAGYETSIWLGLLAPAGTPAAVLGKLAEAAAATSAAVDLASRFREQGIDLRPLAPAPFAALIAAEVEKWAGVVRAAGITTN